MGSFRNTARGAEWFLFRVLDFVFNGGEAYRAAERNDTNREREEALVRLERLRKLRRRRLAEGARGARP